MKRGKALKFAILLVLAVPASFLLGAFGEGAAFRHGLSTPGTLLWGMFHPVGSTFSGGYMNGFWTVLTIDGIGVLILLTFVCWGAYAVAQVLRRASSRGRAKV
jgi:hypothetical protein